METAAKMCFLFLLLSSARVSSVIQFSAGLAFQTALIFDIVLPIVEGQQES